MLAVIRVLFFFATLFAILPAFANPAVVLVEEFTITVDQPSLYRAWAKNDNAYKAANPWNVVWSKNCERLQMECTDQAYRKLPAGTKMHLPADRKSVV